MRHLVKSPLVGILKLLLTVGTLVRLDLDRLSMDFHHVNAEVRLPDEVGSAVRTNVRSLSRSNDRLKTAVLGRESDVGTDRSVLGQSGGEVADRAGAT